MKNKSKSTQQQEIYIDDIHHDPKDNSRNLYASIFDLKTDELLMIGTIEHVLLNINMHNFVVRIKKCSCMSKEDIA